jgi:hypothetical protein
VHSGIADMHVYTVAMVRRRGSCIRPTYHAVETLALVCVLHFPICGPVVEVCETAEVEVASGDAVVDGSGSARAVALCSFEAVEKALETWNGAKRIGGKDMVEWYLVL